MSDESLLSLLARSLVLVEYEKSLGPEACEAKGHFQKAEVLPGGGIGLVCVRCGNIGLTTTDVNAARDR